MRFYADLHVHSKYSRATSQDCDLEHLALYAKRKGISVVGTGDFTHPAWWQEIVDKLVPAEPGLYRLKPELEREVDSRLPPACRREVRFLLEVEISTIYKKGDQTRKVHHLIYAGEMATASRFRDKLGTLGNIRSDGRPILGLDSRHLLEVTLESGSDAYLIPAHIWTPWFSMLGSKSGFDTVAECYGDLAGHIFALETGLSSDPPMNWRVSGLDGYTLVSNSDAHSPPMLGREACVFVGELDYYAMRRALETGEGWGGTVEFFPEEGKYHLDGHRACEVCLEPEETRRLGGLCPVCGKPLTVGVLHRVETLADRPAGEKPARTAPFRSIIQLPQLVAEIHGVGVKSKAVEDTLQQLAARVGPELELIDLAPLEEVRRLTHPLLAEALDRLRRGKVFCEGGYDGEYGVIRVFEPGEVLPQLSLVSLLGLELPEPAPKKRPLPASPPLFAPPAFAAVPAPRRSLDHLPLLERLDPAQRAAAEIVAGPLLIVAGPGTGKTRTLTHRLAHLVENGADPRRCLAITFTRRAAAELAERLDQLLGAAGRGIAVRTFHGLGFDILRAEHELLELPPGFRIADAALAAEILGGRFGLSKAEARRTLEALGNTRRRRIFGGRIEGEVPRLSIETYRSLLAGAGYVDLEDLLVLPVELLDDEPERAAAWQERFDHLAVDEYQDVDPVQYRLLRQITPASGNLCVIGDPDQSIYKFRGADVSFFLRFREDFPEAKTVELDRNYRSQPAIVEAAKMVVAPGTLLPGRRLEPASGKAANPLVLLEGEDEKGEAALVVRAIEQLLGGLSHFSLDSGRIASGHRPLQQVSFDDIAILYRTGAQAAPFEEALDKLGIPYQRRSHERLIERDEVRWLLHHLTLLRDQGQEAPDVAGWLRLAAQLTPQGGGAPSAAKLEEALQLLAPLAQKRGAELDAFLGDLATGAEVDTWDPRAEKVSLLTLHASKGLEFPVVFLAGCDDDLLPFRFFGDDQDVNEERRLFFVGVTRAQDQLYFSRALRRTFRGETRKTAPSPFLGDIPQRLFEKQAPPPRAPKKVEPVVQQLGLF